MYMLERYNTILWSLDVHIFMCIINFYILYVVSLKLPELSLVEANTINSEIIYILVNY